MFNAYWLFDRDGLNDKDLVLGIDEAGRGPWAGPVAVAGALMGSSWFDPMVMDSKKLDAKVREKLAPKIISNAYAWSIKFASAQEIDLYGIRNIVRKLMADIAAELGGKAARVLVDYEHIQCDGIAPEAIIKGDAKSYAIACSSILAKNARDAQMVVLDTKYPEYGFARHKGYGTAEHKEALERLGPILGVHRESFAPIARLISQKQLNREN